VIGVLLFYAGYVKIRNSVNTIKKSEENLQDTQKILKSFVNAISEGIILVDLSDNIVMANEISAKRNGRKLENFIGTSCFDYLPTDIAAMHRKTINDVINLKEISKYEFERHGQYFEITMNPLFDNDGNVNKIAILSFDITKRQQKEKLIREQSRFLKNVIESIPNPFYVVDVNDYSIVMANTIALRNRELDKSTKCYCLTHKKDEPCDSSEHLCPLQVVKNTKLPSKAAHVNFDENDNKRIFEVNGYPVFNDEGTLIYMIENSVDITERKLSEEALITSEKKLRESNATKDKFFSIIAHDLKSPLGSIMNMSQIISKEFDEISDDEKKAIMLEFNKTLKNTYNLLENLLQWANSQTGKIRYNPEQNDINDIIKRNVALLAGAAQNKKITIITNLKDINKLNIDANMINTVTRNLISNAIKFTNKDGVISVSSKEIHGFVEVSVSDNGVGMDELTISKLFRLDVTQTSLGTAKEIGTGLGLILCKEFIERHHGKMFVESESGKGTTIKFSIPSINE